MRYAESRFILAFKALTGEVAIHVQDKLTSKTAGLAEPTIILRTLRPAYKILELLFCWDNTYPEQTSNRSLNVSTVPKLDENTWTITAYTVTNSGILLASEAATFLAESLVS